MRPISLNLASRPFRNNRVVGTAIGTVAGLLLLATAANLYVYLSYGSSYARLQLDQTADRARINGLQVEEKRLVDEIKKRNFKKTYDQGKVAGELILRSAFSWTQLFNTLEAVVPPDVVMTAIRPNITADGIVVRIEGVAKNHGALLSFEERLLRSPAFAKVFPANERRLNPSLQDISFLLTCDYLPRREQQPDQIAAAGDGSGSAPPDAGSDADGAEVRSTVPEHPVVAVASVIGRDGRAREMSAALTPILAPGALYLPAAGAQKTGTVPKPKKAAAVAALKSPPAASPPSAQPLSNSQAPTLAASRPPAPAPLPGQVAGAGKTAAPAAVGAAADRPPDAVAQGGPAGATRTPPRALTGPRNYDPNVLRTMSPEQQAARLAQMNAQKPPVPAVRLDVSLAFVAQPVEEIYQRMAAAHQVRFELDDTVDKLAKVTVNLQGRKLDDAILLMAGMAHHRIQRLAEGVYKVSADEQELANPDVPVEEEPVTEEAPQ